MELSLKGVVRTRRNPQALTRLGGMLKGALGFAEVLRQPVALFDGLKPRVGSVMRVPEVDRFPSNSLIEVCSYSLRVL